MQAMASMGLEASLSKVTDRETISRCGLLATPELVINEKLVCAGHIPEESEVMSWLADAMLQAT